ncbi:hypothetical protein [Arthrobacter sp. YN]|uniref:hypothetical protein n=1 Tax=Arthrobacter sp. YN TaxID=2020486 RepID=UPI0018DF3F80|nr:hypothetical protein [Arthrobacter sp. YN]
MGIRRRSSLMCGCFPKGTCHETQGLNAWGGDCVGPRRVHDADADTDDNHHGTYVVASCDHGNPDSNVRKPDADADGHVRKPDADADAERDHRNPHCNPDSNVRKPDADADGHVRKPDADADAECDDGWPDPDGHPNAHPVPNADGNPNAHPVPDGHGNPNGNPNPHHPGHR